MTQASNGHDSEIASMVLVDIIYRALQKFGSPNIKKIDYRGDKESCELIVTMRVGDYGGDFMISSEDIWEVADEEETEQTIAHRQ